MERCSVFVFVFVLDTGYWILGPKEGLKGGGHIGICGGFYRSN